MRLLSVVKSSPAAACIAFASPIILVLLWFLWAWIGPWEQQEYVSQIKVGGLSGDVTCIPPYPLIPKRTGQVKCRLRYDLMKALEDAVNKQTGEVGHTAVPPQLTSVTLRTHDFTGSPQVTVGNYTSGEADFEAEITPLHSGLSSLEYSLNFSDGTTHPIFSQALNVSVGWRQFGLWQRHFRRSGT